MCFSVDVSPTGNVALGKPATQSSTYSDPAMYGAHRALDGDPSGIDPTNWSCSHTLSNEREWWMVDLLQSTAITDVTIYTRHVAEGTVF